MTGTMNYVNRNNKLKITDSLFIIFCLFPFVIPNPIVTTNIQPYAALFGTVVIVRELIIKNKLYIKGKAYFFGVSWLTLLVSLLVLFINDITVNSFRAFFNYYSVAIVPLALYLVLYRVGAFPEKFIKSLIVIWFIVSSIQFFVDRGFLTSIIGGVRYSYSYRGVVGLASEPSFLGIACFYFLHMIMRFKKNQMVFFAITLIMGIVYAQSMMGVLFIGSFVLLYLLDMTNTRKGFYIWMGAVISIVIFIILLNTVLIETRLYQLFSLFIREGIEGVLNDASAGARYDSLTDAISDSFSNYLLPLGYVKRIGSGYGGFLCELGLFALPILWCISLIMSRTFKKRATQILYFIVVTILLFNNTQIGNPLLLFVISTNLYFSSRQETKGVVCDCK